MQHKYCPTESTPLKQVRIELSLHNYGASPKKNLIFIFHHNCTGEEGFESSSILSKLYIDITPIVSILLNFVCFVSTFKHFGQNLY